MGVLFQLFNTYMRYTPYSVLTIHFPDSTDLPCNDSGNGHSPVFSIKYLTCLFDPWVKYNIFPYSLFSIHFLDSLDSQCYDSDQWPLSPFGI